MQTLLLLRGSDTYRAAKNNFIASGIMKNEKKLTRICLSFDPPRLKLEFTKGEYRTKYHKTIRMERNFTAEKTTCGARAIHNTLVNNHSELSQAYDKVL